MDCAKYDEECPKEYDIVELLPCIICNRSFRPTLLQRHSALCEKNAKKRKVPFDSSKQRRQGTEMSAYLPQVKKTQDTFIGVEKSKKNWKAKHEQLIRDLKAARGVKCDDKLLSSKPIDSETCPHCERNFGPKSYDRHVEFCRERAQRMSTTPVISQSAKERLEARIKYRAPPFKPLRTTTKEKYSPRAKSCSQNVSSVPMKAVQPLKNMKKISSANGNMSNKFRQPTVSKKNDQMSKSLYGNKNAIYLPQKPNNINEKAMKKSESAYSFSSHNQLKQEVSIVNNNSQKNISKSQPHLDNYDSNLDTYDPFKSAEQQMKELELDIIDIGLKNPLHFNSADNNENLQISPKSAFVRYSPVPVTSPDSNNENAFSNQFHSDSNLNNHPLHSLSNLSLCSIVSIESADFCPKAHSAELPKSSSKRSVSKKQIPIENMLYGDSEKNRPNLKFDIAEQELLKSVSEFENLLKLTDDDDIVSPSLNRTSAISMINGVNSNSSADSAYGSLNRKSEEVSNDNYISLLKVAKFCHECGVKYPIADVKFCTECGMRRIIL